MQAGHGQFDFSSDRQWRASQQVTMFEPAATSATVAGHRWLINEQFQPLRRSLCSLLACSLLLTIASSCARIQLPAIDPNGSCIFLPLPNTTQLTLPSLHAHHGQPSLIPQPAFSAPAMPPPCVDGDCEPKTKHKLLTAHKLGHKLDRHFPDRGQAGELMLTPKLVVAPVGGEVVLLAGICGPDGYLVKRQPLEWMLSPDSVGTFIEVGDDSPGHLISALSLHKAPKVEKLDVDYAKGRTSSKETLVDRGSADCKDDIQLKEGQTWLSISSPSEGVSRVTALAPDSDIWDHRRQTATIYWVDAAWEFPQPMIERSGNPLQFVTRVTKSERLVPAEDWIVQYTILDPSVAAFTPPTGSNVARVRVNSDGQAAVQAVAPIGAQGQPSRGTTPILIDVIRPAQPSDNLPEIKVGSGQTFATFSSPGLNLQAFGNDVGSVGEQLTYVASLGNPGDVPAENTRLVVNIPTGTRLISAVPQPITTNTGLEWDQGILDAHRQLDVSVVLEALRPGTFDVNFAAAAAGNLTARSSVRTEIVEASVELRFEPTQRAAQAEVGQVIEYAIDVRNTSRQTLTDLRVVIESSPGLPEAETQRNSVEKSISYLEPGQLQPLGINFVVRQTGQLPASVRVYAGQNLLAEQTTSVLGVEPRPKQPEMGISIELPQTMRVGTTFDAYIRLRNSGEVKLTELNVELAWDGSLRAVAVDRDQFQRFRSDGRSAVWRAPDLLPPISANSGDMVSTLKLSFECLSATNQGTFTARVSAAEGVQANDIANFQVIQGAVAPPLNPPPVAPPSSGANPPVTPPALPPVIPPGAGSPGTGSPVTPSPGAQPRTGSWEIDIADFGDPSVVGNTIRYTLSIRNNQNVIDRDVRVEVQYPQGVSFQGVRNLFDGSEVGRQFGSNNTVSFAPLNSVRAGETISYVFELRPDIPGLMNIRARVYSAGQPEPREAQETTTVQARVN